MSLSIGTSGYLQDSTWRGEMNSTWTTDLFVCLASGFFSMSVGRSREVLSVVSLLLAKARTQSYRGVLSSQFPVLMWILMQTCDADE